jgi:hypothetical protein
MADLEYDAPAGAPHPTLDEMNTARPSSLDKAALFRHLKREFRDDASHSGIWRREAKEDFDFIAGRQWTPEEKSQLNAQLRPEIVFNRAITIIKAVAGFEINSRHEIQFLPRGIEDTAVNEVLTGASKWMGQDCDAEDEESEAFGHTLICGMGFTESRMDYELQRNGKYIEEWVNPLEMYWDRKARKKNLVDARRMWRVKKMALADAMDLCPGYDKVALDARWAVGLDPEEQTKTLEEKRRREENASDNFTEPVEVHIVHAQWWERETYWLVADPVTNKKMELSEQEYAELQRRLKVMAKFMGEQKLPPMNAVKLKRRRFKQCFLGNEILGEVENAPDPDGFSWKCITGEPDFNKGTWFGLIRIMRDPAKWSNKFFSQILHILNSQAKGGIFAEEDFAADQRKFEENYAKPEAITKVKKGSLSNPNGPKWAAKPVANFPQGFQMLLEFAVSSIRDVTGINLELLGLRDMNQPGILEVMRKQAGMTVLATLFDSPRRFRKLIGRTRLYFIQNFISDGRIIRITGPEGAKAVPLIRDKCLGEYDVIVDDTPTSPNQKEANWAIIAPMLPMFKDQLAAMPELLVSILEYSPLPSRLVDLLRALISKPNPEQDEAKKLAIAALVARINKDQSTAEMQDAKAGATQATAMYDLAMAHNLIAKHNANDGNGKDMLDQARELAEIDTETAKAENLRAKTRGQHATTAATHVGTAVEAMTPIPHHRDAFPPAVPAKTK